MSQTRDSQKLELAPSGTLRAAINLGNPVLAQRRANGELAGVSVELARALAKHLNISLKFVVFEAAGQVVAAREKDGWDLAFLARDPKRAETICFTEPYVIIEGTYLVPKESPYLTVADMDRNDVRIAVGKGAAYDLFLTRTLQHASLIRAPTSAEAIDWFITQELEAVAGVRQPLEHFAHQHTGYRVLADTFTQIEQAMALPREREKAAHVVENFLRDRKTDGFVSKALQNSGQTAQVPK